MNAGFSGTFVISWAQTELDGDDAAPVPALRIGTEWRWSGQAVRVDGPADILLLGKATGMADMHLRAAARLHKKSDRALTAMATVGLADPPALPAGFTVTDGHQSWDLAIVQPGPDQPPLLICTDGIPPRNRDLWVVRHSLAAKSVAAPGPGVICFTPGTLIQTETGHCPVELLTQGDRVQTKDNGCQAVLWMGRRRLTGARLYAMPQLRPVRFAQGALDQDIPDAGLLVSPDHRIILRGDRAKILFGCDEVLVRARDLINDRTILTDHSLREVTYVHLLLPDHQIVFANAVETESFHPAGAALGTMDAAQLAALEAQLPFVTRNPQSYGAYARRVLSAGEAAILQSALA